MARELVNLKLEGAGAMDDLIRRVKVDMMFGPAIRVYRFLADGKVVPTSSSGGRDSYDFEFSMAGYKGDEIEIGPDRYSFGFVIDEAAERNQFDCSEDAKERLECILGGLVKANSRVSGEVNGSRLTLNVAPLKMRDK